MNMMLERLMAKVSIEPNSGCWLWLGADDGGDGYGRIVVNGRQRSAHRVSYELHRGAIPDGLHIDHLCRVRCCVNPDHLEPVTCGENIRRGASGAKPKKTCIRGHSFEATGYLAKSGQRLCRECVRIRQRESRARTIRHDQVAR